MRTVICKICDGYGIIIPIYEPDTAANHSYSLCYRCNGIGAVRDSSFDTGIHLFIKRVEEDD